jgi:signal transduction histidine kinase/DNA-binding response OmpR family regulator
MDHTLEKIRREVGDNFAFLQKPFERDELIQLVLLLSSDWQREQQLIETEKQLTIALEKAEQASRAKDDFLASMSHELRTPLSSILGNNELLAEFELGEYPEQLIRSMEVSGKSLLYLINDILDSSKIASGMFEIDEVPYNPLELLDEMQHIFSNRATDAGIAFRIDQELPFKRMLIGDGRRLAQVLINLLSNAIKFTKQGGVSLSIQPEEAGSSICWRIEDSGIGMDQETLARIFKPFEQADRSISGRFGGTGLGLHISSNLVELMKGRIEVSSELGKGSRFEVILPLKEGEDIDLLQQKRRNTKLPPMSLGGRVLIAEDTPELQIIERRLIEPYGVDIDVAGDGKQVLDMVLQRGYDLILMDMQMPEMDGIEATYALRALQVETPIVALTANVMQHHREQFEEAGCNGFLSKPIDRIALREVLYQYLSESDVALPVEDPGFEIDDNLLNLFKERSTELHHEMISAHEKGEWQQVRRVLHNIKGSGTTFGFPELTTLSGSILKLIDSGNFDIASKNLTDLDRALAKVVH